MLNLLLSLKPVKDLLLNKYVIGALILIALIGGVFFYGRHTGLENKEEAVAAVRSEYNEAIEKQKKEIAEWKAKAAEIKTVEVIRWRERKIYIETNKANVDSRIEKELKDENTTCRIGPNFIGLHNSAANPAKRGDSAN